MPHRIQHLVYLDSAIPEPGQSLIEILDMVYSHEDYEAALPEPSPPYVEKLQYDPRRIEKINKIYIRCTNSEFIDVTRLSKEKVEDEKVNGATLNSPHHIYLWLTFQNHFINYYWTSGNYN